MAKIKYIEANSAEHVVDVEVGLSVMQGAVKKGILGIVGECGGNCACGTCRVYIDEAWLQKTGEASDLEEATMEVREDPRRNKRLSCQIKVTEDLDGLIVRMPESQF